MLHIAILASALLIQPRIPQQQAHITQNLRCAPPQLQQATEASLTAATLWRLSLSLKKEGSSAPATDVTVSLRFEEEPGYEPPQGMVRVEACVPEGIVELGVQPQRWQLSEDPDDRKDSLWIWGLFEQALYPFMLCSLTTARPLALSTGQELKAGTTLYAKLPHSYGSEQGDVLGTGALTVRRVTRYQADLAGLSTADVAEDVGVGSVTAVAALGL